MHEAWLFCDWEIWLQVSFNSEVYQFNDAFICASILALLTFLWQSLLLNMWEHITLYSYNSRISLLSDCLSTFFSSFLYSNSAVKKYWDRIHSCIIHLTRHVTLSESSISFLMFIYLICKFHKAAQHFVNLLQCIMTCFVIFLIWSHRQTDDEKLRIWVLFRKIASLLWLIWICMIMKFSVFCSCIWSLTVLQLRSSTLSKFQLESLLI